MGLRIMPSTSLLQINLYLKKIHEDNSKSKLQIQVATYVFELSAGNCHRLIAALSSLLLRTTIAMRMTVQT
jgi:hypothetical protein